ncbi:MAG: glycosyltransferase family A protein [Gallionella sp.]|nr:glycosyltransferase family A protein [Gallionella sp.]MDD4945626.1 glycosyltransferase family A protein [Gallionella sp.]MDD5612745.1 glycosyltransferase family A protein [Gallionella sp.]
MTVSPATIAVIIPFYQRSAEPLVRAIRSILAQQEVARPLVLIVDDGSPVPARQIVAEHFPAHEDCLRIIEQPNAGAATARNTGLDNVPDGVNQIAFMDSDDEWSSHHLAHAQRLYEQGYEFYFADHQRGEWPTGKFAMLEFPGSQHRCLDEAAGLYEYRGNFLLPVMSDHLVQTSSVVCSNRVIRNLRFPVGLVLGEDEIVWIKALRAAGKIGFCNRVEALMGKGVNISQMNQDGGQWGDERAFQLMAQNFKYWQHVGELLPDEPELEQLRKSKLQQLGRHFSASVLHRLRRGQSLPMRHLISVTLTSPGWLLSLPAVLSGRLTKENT